MLRKYPKRKLIPQQVIERYLCQLKWIILMTRNRICLLTSRRSWVEVVIPARPSKQVHIASPEVQPAPDRVEEVVPVICLKGTAVIVSDGQRKAGSEW